MVEIKAPEHRYSSKPTLFIAGGITGTEDWQSELVNSLKDQDLAIYNPRRTDFDCFNFAVEREQIEWESRYLNLVNAISFWFPKESICPIALYELGAALTRSDLSRSNSQKIFIGCDSGYPRIRDIRIQTKLINPSIEIVPSIRGLAEHITYWLQMSSQNTEDILKRGYF